MSKAYTGANGDTPVLRDVDLELRAGDKASLVGPSGSGKSTLLSLIAGLLRPDTGTVEIDGVAVDSLGDNDRARIRSDRVGIALQADNLIPFLSARENVELALGFHPDRRRGRARRAEARTRALDLLDRFAVAHRSEHRPRHLSGGEAQRVALAVSMANDPSVLLADEVVAALDGATASRVVDAVLDGPFAVLYVTHDLELADRVDHRFAIADQRVVVR